MKRGQTGLCAIVAVDKPEGCTSHDVISRIRRITGERRVGHCGTLDPFATGMLLVCIGPATRLSNYLMDSSKGYIARIAFGVRTDTDDLTGASLEVREVPRQILDPGFAASTLAAGVGDILQLPPSYSAKKIDGRKAYELARKGQAADIAPVPVSVLSAFFLGMGAEEGPFGELPYWDVVYEVAKGTCIRSLARDLGEEIGCGAHLSRLRRTSACGVGLSEALTLDELEERFTPEALGELCIDPAKVLGYPVHELGPKELAKVVNGAPLRIRGEAPRLAMVSDGRLHAIYARGEGGANASGASYACETMIPGGVMGVRG